MARRAGIVQVDRLCDQVYALILDGMHAGTYVPGQRLLEVELAHGFNVSRTPVREALIQLKRNGLVVHGRKGYYIPNETTSELEDKHEIRMLLEPRIAHHAAMEASDKEIDALQRVMQKERECHAEGDVKGFIEANREFGQRWRYLCKNKALIEVANIIINQFDLSRQAVHQSPKSRKYSVAHHAKLFAAIKNRNAEEAERLTRQFLKHLKEVLLETYS